MWTQYLFSNQGFEIDKYILYQENNSTILLEENGSKSSYINKKHIKTRYFYIRYHINSGEVSVENCPTDYMLVDYFTKTVQGVKFHDLWDCIMGIPDKVYGPSPSSHTSTK